MNCFKRARRLAARALVAGALLGAVPQAMAEDRTTDWSGAYFGANIGWGHADYGWGFNPANAGAPNQFYSLEEDDGLLGGHAGLQVQIDQIVRLKGANGHIHALLSPL